MILKIVEHVWEGVKVVSPGIEMLVFLLIAFEVYVGIKERRREHRRKRLVDERVAEMRKAMAEGQVLVLSNPQSDDPRVAGWAQAVSNWSEETRRLLKSYSEHAEFHVPGAGARCFRRFRAAQLKRAACPDDLRKFWLGHASDDISDHYALQLLEDVKRRKVVAASVGLGFEVAESPYSFHYRGLANAAEQTVTQ